MRLTEDRLREYAKQIISMESKCIEWGATAERSVELCMEELRKMVAESEARGWHPLNDKPKPFHQVLISDPPESSVSSRVPTRFLAHVDDDGAWCTWRNGKSERIHESHLRRTMWTEWPFPPAQQECSHEWLNEDGICRACGEDRRGI